jgi:hypothetical protein
MLKEMYLNAFYSLILILSTNALAKTPAVFPIGTNEHGEVYVSFGDLQQLKIMFLVFACYALINIIKWIINVFTKSELKTREAMHKRLNELEDKDNEILKAIQRLEIHMAHMKDGQVGAEQVRQIARDELNYLNKVRDK